MNKSHILLIEDDPAIGQSLLAGLEHHGFDAHLCTTGVSGVEYVRQRSPHLIILDIRLPDGSGFDFCRQMRQEGLHQPVLMLTAQQDELDKILGLEMGADDYMTKPFSPKELVARVRAVFRRIENVTNASSEMIRVADLTLDVPRMRVTAESREIEELTPTEFELLVTLARQPGRIFTRAQLLDAIHGVAFESYERAIDAHIKNIRRKLEVRASEPKYVLTVYGVGYKFADK
jgi:DNA-binding response OmpR family regulator